MTELPCEGEDVTDAMKVQLTWNVRVVASPYAGIANHMGTSVSALLKRASTARQRLYFAWHLAASVDYHV